MQNHNILREQKCQLFYLIIFSWDNMLDEIGDNNNNDQK